MNYRTPLRSANGLGSAKHGTQHWWLQRVTSVLLLILSYWLVTFLSLCVQAPYQDTLAWLQCSVNNVALCGWILAALYHASLGLQVVIEDYVHSEAAKIIGIWAIKCGFFGLGLFCVTTLISITG